MKLALGTAQFGLDYGVSNASGQVEVSEVKDILREADGHNIDTLDTAMVYGISESVLGRVGVNQFNIVTKLPPIPKDVRNIDLWVNTHINSSLRKMRIERVSGLLLHRSADLFETPKRKLIDSLCKLKDDGVINKIGVSIYNPDELDDIEKHGIKIDIVQAPFNILDRRLESSGWLGKLHLAGIEVHTRSVFLQGLLLQKEKQRNIERQRGFLSRLVSTIFSLISPKIQIAIFAKDAKRTGRTVERKRMVPQMIFQSRKNLEIKSLQTRQL